MAVTTELVGKLGGGLTWTKVAGSSKTVAWNASAADRFLTSVVLDKSKTYLFACKYNYTSGTPLSTMLSFVEVNAAGTGYIWAINCGSTSPVKTGANTYPLVGSLPAVTTGKVAIRLDPSYNSGTHVLSADLYYAELTLFREK